MFKKRDQQLLAEAYDQVLNEGLFDFFKKKKPAPAAPAAPAPTAAAPAAPAGNYPVVQPDMIRFDLIDNRGGAKAYSFSIGGMDGGGILVNGDNVLFANSDKQNALSPEFRYPETNDNTYKKPLNPFNGKQFSGGLEGFKKELLNILNTDEMVSYMKQYTADKNKERDAIFARQQAQAQKFRDSRK